MATYAIGDIQGCHLEFQRLLDKIKFESGHDRLWLTGDIVNRGPDSLGALRLAKKFSALSVLGNHECHLLAVANGVIKAGKKDTFSPIINADDSQELLDWIRQFPLIHHDAKLGYTMVHAGLHPAWSLNLALELANEVESIFRSDKYIELLDHMYGDNPDQWQNDLSDWKRIRCIINYCTRTRYCKKSGRIDFKDKGPPGTQRDGTYPWYSLENRKSLSTNILFGHWASLHDGDPRAFQHYNVYPLDTGCVWGRKLTAIRLEDRQIFQVSAL